MHPYSTSTEEPPRINYLRHVYTREDGARVLHQAKVTNMVAYESFRHFVDHFWGHCSFPRPQGNKQESYGFLPTFFEESDWTPRLDPTKAPVPGTWRRAEHSAHQVSLMYLDLDNPKGDRPYVSLDEVEATLTALGLSHLLYTSFSHTEGRPKVRALMPISRAMDYETAFRVYLWFNAVLNEQLDGAIYDDADFLYGPPFQGTRRQWLEGGSIDVDAVLALVDELPDAVLEPLQHRNKVSAPARSLAPEEVQRVLAATRDHSVRGEITIKNPEVFNPAWFEDLRCLSNGGSHRQTLFAVLTRVFVKSGHALTFGELCALQREIDAEWYFYCQQKYGRSGLQADVRSVLAFRGSNPLGCPNPDKRRDAQLNKEIERLRRKRA